MMPTVMGTDELFDHRFKRVPSAFSPHIGTQEYLLAQHGLSGQGIACMVQSVLETRKEEQ